MISKIDNIGALYTTPISGAIDVAANDIIATLEVPAGTYVVTFDLGYVLKKGALVIYTAQTNVNFAPNNLGFGTTESCIVQLLTDGTITFKALEAFSTQSNHGPLKAVRVG